MGNNIFLSSSLPEKLNLNASLFIGMPVYNDEKFLKESLDSVLAQTYRDFVLVCSDDHSSDRSLEILKEYAAFDDRIHIVHQEENIGISKNMMFLLSLAENNTFFMFAGDDDLLGPDYCKELIQLIEQSEQNVGAFAKFDVINEDGSVLNKDVLTDYSSDTTFGRIKKFVQNSDDAIGYGVFRTNIVKYMRFPIWWWPNQKVSYNNIYPSLCFRLAKGNIPVYSNESIYQKRVKSAKFMNHSLTTNKGGKVEFLKYVLRRFYLVIFTLREINRAKNIFASFRLIFPLFRFWFFKSIFEVLPKRSSDK